MKKVLLFINFLLIFQLLDAQENRVLNQNLNLKVNISFDRERYRIGEATELNIEISNLHDDVVLFYTSPYKLNNFKIKILDLQQGEELEEQYSKLVELNNLKQEKPELFILKETRLYPDEILKVKIDLQEYFEFKKPGRYKIEVEFNPFPYQDNDRYLLISHPVYLQLDKSRIQRDYDDIVEKLRSIEEAKSYSPDGTIQFMLEAYQRKDWNDYFLYQNLRTILLQYEPFKSRFMRSSENRREKIIEEFKNWMINQKNKELENYQILEFNQSNVENKSYVKCKIKYRKPAEFNTYYYQYTLHKEGIKWIVDDVEVLSYSKEK